GSWLETVRASGYHPRQLRSPGSNSFPGMRKVRAGGRVLSAQSSLTASTQGRIVWVFQLAGRATVLAEFRNELLKLVMQVFRRPGDRLVADEKMRRAVDAHLGGESFHVIQLSFDGVACHVGFELSHIEPETVCDFESGRLVGLAFGAEHSLVEFPVLALTLGGQGDLCGFLRALRQDRQLLEDDAHFLVVLNKLLHFGQSALAVATVEIEEFNDGYVAIRVACDGAV